MRRLIGGLILGTCAAILAAAVVAGVRKSRRLYRAEPLAEADDNPKTSRNFSIRRTKSEVGYVYWILEGYGRYKCFILCDSWQEAMDEANARLAPTEGMTASAATASF